MYQAIIVSIAISIDIFLTSFSYQMSDKKIGVFCGLMISFISAAVLSLSIFFSRTLSIFLTYKLCMRTGALILAVIGSINIIKSIREIAGKKNNAENDDIRCDLDIKSAFFLGCVLSTDALASGLALGLMEAPCIAAGLFCLGFGIAALIIGKFTGKMAARSRTAKKHDFSWINGAVLIGIACWRWI